MATNRVAGARCKPDASTRGAASRRTVPAWSAVCLTLAAFPCTAATPDPVLELAHDRGCLVCHEVGSGPAPVAQLLPTAPSFRDIARRYHAQPGAAVHLTQVVVNGTPGESGRHWQDKAAGSVMFGDQIVSQDEARRLVAWILAMDARPAAPGKPGGGQTKR